MSFCRTLGMTLIGAGIFAAFNRFRVNQSSKLLASLSYGF